MANCDILQSNSTSLLNDQNNFFLTNTVNWEFANIRQITTKLKEVESVRQIINTILTSK